jgi:Zn-dependent metalloprotease
VFDGNGGMSLPGTLVREEGGAPAADAAAERVFEWLGQAHRFLYDAFGRDSIDGNGTELLAVVHYGTNYGNGFWDGRHAVLGDGDDQVMRSLASTPDVSYKQVMNGFVQHAASFDYQGQAGSLHDAAAIVFALMARQFVLRQPVEAADWRFGAGLLLPQSGLTVIADPSTPATWKDFTKTTTDSGGVHANSPIVQHAFFGLAVALGGQAWERAGRIWYDALVDPELAPDSTFRQFAARTVGAARARFGDAGDEVTARRAAWGAVGIKP